LLHFFVTRPPEECSYTFNDVVAATQALREISTGHEEAAATILSERLASHKRA
jgi:hypothetical protein